MSKISPNLCVDIDWSDHWRIDNGISAAANGQTHDEWRMLLLLSGAVDAKLSIDHLSIHLLLYPFHRMRKQ